MSDPIPTALSLYTKLVTPWDRPYTTADARERARDLLKLYAMAEQDREIAAVLVERSRRSFWVYLCLFAWTFDPKSGARMRVKPFAPRRVYKVLSDFADERNEDGTWSHPTLFVSKSRQLMLSWWSIHRLAWSAQSAEFGEYPVISKTEDDAKDLMRRLRIAYASYPAFYKGGTRAFPATTSAGEVEHSNGSRIWAMAQRGGDAARGAVPTMYLFDEAAFQSDFEKNYQAIRGTAFTAQTQGIVVSTAQVSAFWDLASDAMDGRKGGRGKVHHSSTGIDIYENATNKIDVARIHYTAYEERRTAEWIAQARRGVPMHVWRQEFEIDPFARGGQPVFPMLDRDAHMVRGAITIRPVARGGGYEMAVKGVENPDTGVPLWRPVALVQAVDFGIRRFAATWHAITLDEYHDWYVYRAYVGRDLTWDANARAVADLSAGEVYRLQVGDCMQRLIDAPGQIIDLLNRYKHHDGRQPFLRMCKPTKGQHSRREGVDAVQGMLLSALAINIPEHSYWDTAGYDADHRDSFANRSGLYIGPQCEELFTELDQARFDERKGDAMLDAPDTTVDMQDDLIDTLRYAIAGAGHLVGGVVG